MPAQHPRTDKENTVRQLDLFGAERLPNRPYCSDDLAFGVKVRPLETALRMKYLQPNPPHTQFWLVADIDAPLTPRDILALIDQEKPTPNFLIINPENQHAHAFYLLETPVAKGEHASAKALRYCAAIEAALIRALGADACYTGLIAKNPLHDAWRLVTLREPAYTLGELHDALDLRGPAKSVLRKAAVNQGLGRNTGLFDSLRLHAYQWVSEYKAGATYEQWRRYLAGKAEGYNADNIPPLDASEVAHVVKSVAKWTWYVYTGRMPDKQFSQLQAKRGARGGRISAKARAEAAGGADLFAQQMGAISSKGISEAKPWEAEGISRKTWYRDQKLRTVLVSDTNEAISDNSTR